MHKGHLWLPLFQMGQNKPTPVAGVFISQKDAQAFVERLKKEKPELGQTVQVVPVSLAEVYKLKKIIKTSQMV
jgi:hypothetical protein